MKLLTQSIRNTLISNHEHNLKAMMDDGNTHDFNPIVKLFNPCGAATWLISELDPETDIMFGLCDLGMGFAELGNVSLDELSELTLPFGLGIERDTGFTATKSLTAYADDARANNGTITV